MKYTTTKCRNCGFRTRSHESNVPNVQLGAPILPCPQCGHLILDSIATEYEFMTDAEREKFKTDSALVRSYPGNVLFIIMGLFLLIGGIANGNILFGLLFGAGCIVLGISRIIENSKMADEQIIEQEVYESLQRTKNIDYVKFIEESYAANKIKRRYHPFDDKGAFMDEHKIFETRQSYIQNMKVFNELMELMGVDTLEKESKSSTFINL